MGRRLRCGKCGKSLRCQAQPRGHIVYKYYACDNKDCTRVSCRVGLLDETIWEWVKSLLLDPTRLSEGLANYQKEKEQDTEPIRERIRIASELLADHKAQLERLVDLYLSGTVAKEHLVDRKNRLETTISALEAELASLKISLQGQILTPEQEASIEAFSAEVRAGLKEGDTSFERRRQLIDLLNVTGTLSKENDELVVYARCVVGAKTLAIETTTTCGNCSCKYPRRVHPTPGATGRWHARHQ